MNTFIRPSRQPADRQTDRQTDRHIQIKKQHKPTGKNLHHTYKTIKTQNNETT